MLYNPKECGERKKVCPFFLLENSRPLFPWGPLDSLSTCLGTDSLRTLHWKLEAAHRGNVHRMDTNVHHRNDKCHNLALADCFADGLDLESDGESVTHGDQMHRRVCGAALQRPRNTLAHLKPETRFSRGC